MNSLLLTAQQTYPALRRVLLRHKAKAADPAPFQQVIDSLADGMKALRQAGQTGATVKRLRGKARTDAQLKAAKSEAGFRQVLEDTAQARYTEAMLQAMNLLAQ